jgi:hypothetical protein
VEIELPHIPDPAGPAPWVVASAVQVWGSASIYRGVESTFPESNEEHDAVRCVECGTEYTLSSGVTAACPSCGCPTWISAQIPGPGLRPL